MSVNIIEGNIFNTSCQTIVNTVNCVGVMGAGIALECRLRYPEMYDRYIKLCAEKRIDIGLLWIYKSEDKWVLNFPTKKHWRYPSRIEYLHLGLKKFVETYNDKGIESIAFPLLGADKGGIDQEESLAIMTSYLEKVNINVEIYRYSLEAKDDLFDKTKEWLIVQDIDDISRATNIRKSALVKLRETMQSKEIHQLNQLGNIKGIGIKTLEKIFVLAKNSVPVTVANSEQHSLF